MHNAKIEDAMLSTYQHETTARTRNTHERREKQRETLEDTEAMTDIVFTLQNCNGSWTRDCCCKCVPSGGKSSETLEGIETRTDIGFTKQNHVC